MDKQEFINTVIGVKWVNRGVSFDGMDCHGLNVLYHKHVLGVDIGIPAGYIENICTSKCWESEIESGRWLKLDRHEPESVVFTCYNGNMPLHVGMVISQTHVLHCRGSENEPGRVEIHSLAAIKRLYGRVTFHKFKGLL